MDWTCIIVNGQQGATSLVAKGRLIMHKLMGKNKKAVSWFVSGLSLYAAQKPWSFCNRWVCLLHDDWQIATSLVLIRSSQDEGTEMDIMHILHRLQILKKARWWCRLNMRCENKPMCDTDLQSNYSSQKDASGKILIWCVTVKVEAAKICGKNKFGIFLILQNQC